MAMFHEESWRDFQENKWQKEITDVTYEEMVFLTRNPDFERFKEQFPEQSAAFITLFQTVSAKALDEKTKQLVYLGILTAKRYAPAVRVHIRKAIEAGASLEEIKEAMMLAIPAAELCDFLAVMPEIFNELDE